MNEKSYVGMAYRVCPITGEEWQTGELLLDKRMKDSLEKKTIIGYGLCPEVQERIDNGYVALVEIDPDKSKVPLIKRTMGVEDAHKTGRVAYVKRQVAIDMFGADQPMNYVDIEVFNILIELEKNIKDDGDPKEETGD